ncbi:unnamed protein product [Hermetia illucens]|uniref:non-specific serine/threonine protein kinase n=1 Tax=Hermetia illucens TaxID=343691 RepID=A0A7R8V195_HERIL|nr:death-associated protein kinase related [Hermetia illucens]CAD7090763.1 unnamed protein product [Hermetia illucens]
MLSDGIRPIGDGLLDVEEERLRALLVPQDINEVYEVEQTPFARGKFAAVRRAVHKSSGTHFAAKFLKRRRRAQSSDKEIKHEIAVLMLCSGSENIVKLNAVHESRSDTALLLELATGGELQAILDDEGSLTEAQARFCMRQVLKALQFLHKRSIAHLDLKPQNILLAGKRVEDGLKLCDFGISRVIENGSKIREILGTPDYVAPEVLQYDPLSLQTDIWSVGVLAYVLLTGCTPFGGDTKQETFLNISQCSLTFPDELFKDVSQGAIDFIKSTLRIKPEDRLNAIQCLEHIWLKDESPMSSTFLSVSRNSTDHPRRYDSGKDLDFETVDIKKKNKSGDDYRSNEYKSPSTTTTTTNGCASDRYNIKSTELNIDTNRSRYKYRSTSPSSRLTNNSSSSTVSDDCSSNEHDKENFLVNSTNVLSTSNIRLSSLQKYGTTHELSSKISAQSKLSSSVSTKLSTSNSAKYVNIESCNGTASLKHYHTTTNGAHEPVDYVRSCIEKIRSPTNGSTPTAVTTATICIFPDAPTTPKVIRKTPPETTRSVKALVKKFQLESEESNASGVPPLPSTPPPSMLSTASTTGKLEKPHINENDSDYRVVDSSSNHNSSNSSNNSNSYKSTCVFCLTCGGPGCRHSGRTSVSKSSGNLGIDQGIIC